MAKGDSEKFRPVAQNRRARYDYEIEDTLEAGIILFGPEVKSLREGRSSINEAYAGEEGGEIYLYNAYIPEYKSAHVQQEPRRKRKLLLHKKEVGRLIGGLAREGMTVVPLSIYFNRRGIAKVGLGLARGKKKTDKRRTIKERDWKREKARTMREKG